MSWQLMTKCSLLTCISLQSTCLPITVNIILHVSFSPTIPFQPHPLSYHHAPHSYQLVHFHLTTPTVTLVLPSTSAAHLHLLPQFFPLLSLFTRIPSHASSSSCTLTLPFFCTLACDLAQCCDKMQDICILAQPCCSVNGTHRKRSISYVSL